MSRVRPQNNGNTTQDPGRNITNIRYNFLNLPTQVSRSTGQIKYSYSGGGQKLKALFGNGTQYDYLSMGVWKNDTLEFLPTAEGRFVPNKGVVSTGRYEYHYQDHLGNLRLSCACKPDSGVVVLQENHYDAWGLTLPIGVNGDNRYLFTGKETQPETGYIDFGARQYDPALGRWLGIDPLAEKMRRYSPYVYGFNNPIRFIDPDGMAPRDWISWVGKNGQQHITYHSGITTKAAAETAGYKNVHAVFGTGKGHSRSTSDKFNFQENGKFSVNGGKTMDVSDGGFTTKGGTFINKGLTGIEQISTGLQSSGDIITATGLATAQPEIIAAGETISNIGLGVEVANDFVTKGFNSETLMNAGMKIGLNVVFGALGDAGKTTTRTVAGKEFVDSGANRVSETIIQGTTTIGNKIVEKVSLDQIKK